MATWRALLSKALHDGDSLDNLIFSPEDIDLDKEFDADSGGVVGIPFLAWSDAWVYFTHVYDGAEEVMSVPRNPSEAPRVHVGALWDEVHAEYYLKDDLYKEKERLAAEGDEEALDWIILCEYIE